MNVHLLWILEFNLIRQTRLDEYQWNAWMEKPKRITYMFDGGWWLCTFRDGNYFSAFFMSISNHSTISGARWAIKIDMQYKRHTLGFGIICIEQVCRWNFIEQSKRIKFVSILMVITSKSFLILRSVFAADKVNGEHWTSLQEIDALDDCMCKVHPKTTLWMFVFKSFCRQQTYP